MKDTELQTANHDLLMMVKKIIKKDGNSPDMGILHKYNLSNAEWNSFVNLTLDLELNEEGIKILLDEMLSGNVYLPNHS